MAYAMLEIIASAFESATQEMAASLVRTAYSPNIKERADCSTAICDVQGRALSLMTHAPAHLGSTLRLVPQVLKRYPLETLQPGDAFLANDPYIVGVTHLNDCTVAMPVFMDGRVVAFSVAVAHHSDVGGRIPGSEAGDSVSIFQEGIRVPPVQLYAAGKVRADILSLSARRRFMSLRPSARRASWCRARRFIINRSMSTTSIGAVMVTTGGIATIAVAITGAS